MSKNYVVTYVEDKTYYEFKPELKFLTLTPEEFIEVEAKIHDFEQTRLPYFAPRVYIDEIKSNYTKEGFFEWLEELKQDVIQWKRKADKKRDKEAEEHEKINLMLKDFEAYKKKYGLETSNP